MVRCIFQQRSEINVRSDPTAWNIIRDFASTEMTLPDAENLLKTHLGPRYIDHDWRHALKAVMEAEGDIGKAQAMVRELSSLSHLPKLTIKIPARPGSQLAQVETELMEVIEELTQRRCISKIPTLDELIEPAEENEDEDSPYHFEGEAEIVAQVRREMDPNTINVDDDSDDSDEEEEDTEDELTRDEAIKLCAQLEKLSIKFGGENFSLELPCQLRRFRGQLQQEKMMTARQVTLEEFLKRRR